MGSLFLAHWIVYHPTYSGHRSAINRLLGKLWKQPCLLFRYHAHLLFHWSEEIPHSIRSQAYRVVHRIDGFSAGNLLCMSGFVGTTHVAIYGFRNPFTGCIPHRFSEERFFIIAIKNSQIDKNQIICFQES